MRFAVLGAGGPLGRDLCPLLPGEVVALDRSRADLTRFDSLRALCRDHGRTLLHFSTDYVFGLDEARSTPLAETDPPGPVNVYGLSKLAGEYLARAACPRHLVIRTCGLYGVWGSGGKGTNFVETMLRKAARGEPL